MKRIASYLVILVLLVALSSASAQGVTADSPIILGGTGDDSYNDSLSLPNGNLILSIASNGGRDGEDEYAKRTRKTWLVCLAPDGSTVWETEFGDDRAGGYTLFSQLMLGSENSFSGMVFYSIDQHSQYRQMMSFSTIDGSLIQSGERVMDSMDTDNIYRTFCTSQGYRIALEAHNFDTNLKPRMVRLLDGGGNQLWELNVTETGLNHMEQFIPVPQGTVLYGCNDVNNSPNAEVVAMLVDSSGAVVWEYRYRSSSRCVFKDGIIDSQGRLVVMGTIRGDLITNEKGQGMGYEDNTSLLLVCLDVSTGEEIFAKTTEMTDRLIPTDRIAEYGGQYILCGSDANYNTIEFQTIDQDGNLLQHWSDGYPEYGMFGARFILWNGDLWVKAILNGPTMDVFLSRVVIP